MPPEAVTETFAMLGIRRSGKSNGAVVLAEEFDKNGLHWVAVDPKGDWWGMRANKSGKGDGVQVPIFGGLHGDVPLEPGSGAAIADLIVDERLSAILDVSDFASDAERTRWLLSFGDRLFRRKNQTQEPTHVFFEEADEYIPQSPFREAAKLVHVWSKLLKQGGGRGLGGTVISQRAAVVNKNVLTQCQTLFAFRCSAPQDRKAIRDWVSFSGENPEVIETLPQLSAGECWMWSPHWLGKTKRFQYRQRKTFDSGSTPKVGGSKKKAAKLADIDLSAIRQQMAASIERAKADDPKELRRQIAQLEKQLKERPTAEPQVVDIPVFNDEDRNRLDAAIATLDTLRPNVHAVKNDLDLLYEYYSDLKSSVEGLEKGFVKQLQLKVTNVRDSGVVADFKHSPPPRFLKKQYGAADNNLGAAERKLLAALGSHGTLTLDQAAIICGYSARASTMGVAASKLKGLGFIEGSNKHGLTITDEGIQQGPFEQLPVGRELLLYWEGQLGKSERELLRHVVEFFPVELTAAAEALGYSPTASTMGVAASKLRKLKLIEGSNRAMTPNERLL